MKQSRILIVLCTAILLAASFIAASPVASAAGETGFVSLSVHVDNAENDLTQFTLHLVGRNGYSNSVTLSQTDSAVTLEVPQDVYTLSGDAVEGYALTWIWPYEFAVADYQNNVSFAATYHKLDGQYVVTFDALGGNYVNSKVVEPGAAIPQPGDTYRTGYYFYGWVEDPDSWDTWDFENDIVTHDITLYAKWMIMSYGITFDTIGGTPVKMLIADYNTTISTPGETARTGYEFTGWYRDEACTVPWHFDSDKISQSITLYAKWIPNSNLYTVYYDLQDPCVDIQVFGRAAGYNMSITPPVLPTKEGYSFGGWYREAACTNPWDFSTDVVTGDVTLYAKWAINTYTVTFDSQGGSNVDPVSVIFNEPFDPPAEPTKPGWKFDGWYREADCVNPWDFIVMQDTVIQNTTLYAKWVPN